MEFTTPTVSENGVERQVFTPKKMVFADRLRILSMLGQHNRINAFQEPEPDKDAVDPVKALYEQIRGESVRPKA